MLPIVQHMFNIVLQTSSKIPANFLRIANQKPQLGIVHIGLFAALVFAGFIISEFEIANALADIAADTRTVDVKVGKCGLRCIGRLAAGALPIAAITIKCQLIIADIPVKPHSNFVIAEPLVRLVGMLHGIGAGQS